MESKGIMCQTMRMFFFSFLFFCFVDVSVSQTITVTYPNGNEILSGCSAVTITWTKSGVSNFYNIYYSTDNGNTFIAIATSYNTLSGSYVWPAMPNLNSSNCMIKIEDALTPSVQDINNSAFTINGSLIVLTPNDGQNWITGTTQNITYSFNPSSVSNVKIEYSINNGSTWNTIIASTPATGSYSWTIPNNPTTLARIRISDVVDPGCRWDKSDTTFTISSSVNVIQPNGGEIWQATVGTHGLPINISNAPLMLNTGYYYDDGGPSGNFTTNYYTQTLTPDNPLNKLTITFANYNLSTGNLKIYNGPSTSEPLLATLTSSGSNATYTSTHYTGALTFVMTPVGITTGWNAYIQSVGTTTRNINWNIVGTSKYFNIDYSTNGGTSWTNIATNYYSTTGTYAWQVPNTPSTTCRVRIKDYLNYVIIDQSDTNFTITAAQPFITLTSLNGGETIYPLQVKQITWISPTFLTNYVNIEYSIDDGVTWTSIVNNTLNSGSYSWTVPMVFTSYPSSRIRISDAVHISAYDISNNTFTIKPAIELISPNNNSGLWGACTQSSITWNAGISNSYKIEYSSDNGATWITENANYSNASAYVVYNWTVPSIPSNYYQVRVTDNNNLNYFDISQSNFTVSPAITLNYPSNGDVVQVGSIIPIQWTTYNTTNYYKIDYSVNNGISWINIVNNYYNVSGTYSWTVPNNVSNSCLIKISDFNMSCKSDVSDHGFTISANPSNIILSNMNIGNLSGCSIQNINFNAQGLTTVNIDYSMDGGTSWSAVTSNLNALLSTYSWTVPNISTNRLIIRVTDASNPLIYDISNNFMSITPSVSAIITTIGSLTFCEGDSVTLKSNYISGNLWSNGSHADVIVVKTNGSFVLNVNQGGCIATSDPAVVTVNPRPLVPTISINGSINLCAGQDVILTSSSLSSNFWYPNGETSPSITANTSGNYAVSITNGFGCLSSSRFVILSVSTPSTPTVIISTQINSVCQGSSVTFSSNVTNEGTSPIYQWKKNGNNVGSNSGIYVDNALMNNDLIRLEMTSNSSCVSPATVTSNSVLMTVNSNMTPNVSISTPLTTVCSGNSITFTATATNAGTSPIYQWKVNGTNIGTNSNTFTTSSLLNSSNVSCTVMSSAACNTVNPVNSNTLVMTIITTPEAPIVSSNSPVNFNGRLNLFASTITNASYTWTGPNNFSSTSQNPVVANATNAMNGTYSVFATVGGCPGPSGTTVVNILGASPIVNISGNIQSELGQNIPSVKVKLTGAATDSLITTSDGAWNFNVLQGSSYVVTPYKNNDAITCNGITTIDMVMMQRHVVGNQPLSSPYKIIAADVNGSQNVTTIDIVLVKSLILQNITSFPGSKLWNFVNSDFIFSVPSNPFPFENSHSYSSANVLVNQNFIGCKLGDVNNSWNPLIAKEYSNESISFITNDQQVFPGEHIAIPVRVNDFNNVSGFQYTINWDPSILEFVGTNNANLQMDFGTSQTGSGKLAVLWGTELPDGMTLNDGSVIFEVLFNVVGTNGNSTLLSANGSMTITEAVDKDLNILNFNSVDGLISITERTGFENINGLSYALLQNIPNPFDNSTTISFNLPMNEHASLSIYDLNGRIIYETSKKFTEGYHTLTFDANGLSDGTYYYKLQTPNYTSVRKMVLIK